jgi:hypothetical protein
MDTFEAHRHCLSPSCSPCLTEGDHTRNGLEGKLATEPSCPAPRYTKERLSDYTTE